MPESRHNSINRKLIRMNMLVTGAALLASSLAFLFFQLSAFRQSMVRNLSIEAQIAGANTASALLFDDAGSAVRTLSALRAAPAIVFAQVYAPDGTLFAGYQRGSGSAPRHFPPLLRGDTENHRFTADDLSLVHEIIFQGKYVGTIYVRTDLRELTDQVLRYYEIFGVVFVLSLLAAFLLSHPFQRAFTQPIVELAAVARTISREKQFSMRAAGTGSHDEVDILMDAFNEMLSEIQARDTALEFAHERLNLALKSAGIGTWSVGDGRIVWDDFMYPLFGLPPGSFSGTYEGLLELIHAKDRELIRRAVDTSLGGRASGYSFRNDSYDIEFRAVRPNGSLHTLTARGKVYRDENGVPVRMTGVCWDISARKQSEEERRKFVSLVEQTDDLVVMCDLDARITYLNRAGQELVGFDEEDFIGRSLGELHPDDCWEKLRDETLPEVLLGRKNWVGESKLRHVLTEETVDVLMNVFPVTDPETSQLVCFAAIMSDITERKRLEEQLRQAQKLDSVGQLAGGVAHDFNNLLTVIIGYGELILADLPFGDAIREPVQEIHQAAQRASGLTRQLLAFSRRQVTEPRIVRINDLIKNVEKMLRRLIGEEIDMTVTLEDAAGCLRADPGHIEQVIMNLVINARDAMPGGGRLNIETSRLFVDEDFASMHLGAAPGENVILTVSDTGTGMTPEVKARIFEPFFTTKEKGRGTGLGLSTAYGIVKQSGGSIWVYSEPGTGSIFKVFFPLAPDPDGEAFQFARMSSVDGPLAGDETILVAEDEAGVRRYVRQILERNGYTVLEASHGNEAMDIIGSDYAPIHLLLTDVVMRETGGVELADYFARVRPGVPYMYMSGYNEHLWFREDISVNLLQKPFTASSLLKRIRNLLDQPLLDPMEEEFDRDPE